MRRLIVLCLIYLSVLFFPGNAGAIPMIDGAVWSTYALNSARDPFNGSPSDTPDATFKVESINFDSMRVETPKNITYDEFLNQPVWDIPPTR